MLTRPLILALRDELSDIPELTIECQTYRFFARYQPYPWIWRDTKHLISNWLIKAEEALSNNQLHESELAQFMPILLRRIYIFRLNGQRQWYFESNNADSEFYLSGHFIKHLLMQAALENDFVVFKLLLDNYQSDSKYHFHIMYYLLARHNILFYDFFCQHHNKSLHAVFRSACLAYLSKTEADILTFQKDCRDYNHSIHHTHDSLHRKADAFCDLKSWLAIIGRGWLEQYLEDEPKLSTQIVPAIDAADILRTRFYSSGSTCPVKIAYLNKCTRNGYSFKEVVLEAGSILSDTSYCLSLLETLNNKLARELAERNIKLDDFMLDGSSSVYIAGAYAWPVENAAPLPKLYSLLDEVLLETEQEHGLNTSHRTLKEDEKSIIHFNGAVPYSAADQFVKDGMLFKEVRNNSLMHGDNSHRLQIYILIQAIHQGKMQLPDGKTIKDLVRSLIRYHIFDDDRWSALLDNPHWSKFGDLSSPNALYSLLLTYPNPHTRILSAYLRVQFSKSMQQLCDRSELPYSVVLASLGCGSNFTQAGVRDTLKISADDTPLKDSYRSIAGISILAKKKKPPVAPSETLTSRMLSMFGDF